MDRAQCDACEQQHKDISRTNRVQREGALLNSHRYLHNPGNGLSMLTWDEEVKPSFQRNVQHGLQHSLADSAPAAQRSSSITREADGANASSSPIQAFTSPPIHWRSTISYRTPAGASPSPDAAGFQSEEQTQTRSGFARRGSTPVQETGPSGGKPCSWRWREDASAMNRFACDRACEVLSEVDFSA